MAGILSWKKDQPRWGSGLGCSQGSRMEQGKQLSKDSVSAGDHLRPSPRGAQSLTCT